ncbi:MAG: membrane protein insertase YidC [Cytophagales bacterium]|nr:MAG: membrane protein insertase YidC [Cytophagales bacterium]
MDKNQTIGMVMIFVMLFVYLTFFSPEPPPPDTAKQITTEKTDSVSQSQSKTDTSALASVQNDSLLKEKMGFFALGMKGTDESVSIENQDIKITFGSYGAKIKEVLLKNYVTFQKKPLVLIDEKSSKISAKIQTSVGEIALNKLHYSVKKISDTEVAFIISTDAQNTVEQRFSLGETGFVVGYKLNMVGAPQALLKSDKLAFDWTDEVKKLEKDMAVSRQSTTINYYMPQDEQFETLSETATELEEATAETPVRFVSLKHKFFNTSIITDGTFASTKVISNPMVAADVVKQLSTSLEIPIADLGDKGKNIRFYFGPNEYKICEAVTPNFQRNVYLGWGFFTQVNKYLIMPLFSVLEKVTVNYGIVILLLVLVVKLVLLPLQYKSYVGMAKMKVLQPQVNDIRAKYTDPQDMNAQQEIMKFYGKAGVSPLSGCIPLVLQMPVFLSLFNFFPNAIQLRQKTFLWADDLSSYDSVWDFGFSIPFYGDHLSMFTLLFTLSQLAYTYYNNQITVSMQPQMKVISYVMPVMFIFFLNSFASGLTYYYFVSNMITIAQQNLIKRFVDDDKLLAAIAEKQKQNENKKPSSFQQRLQDAMKTQQESAKNKTEEKKSVKDRLKDKNKKDDDKG